MSRSGTIRERFDHFWEWMEAACVEVPGVQTFLFLWKKLGLVGTALVIAVVGFPLGEYSLISVAVNRTLPKLAGDFGMDFDAEWSYHPFSLKAIARNVKIKPEHPAAAAPIFTASEIEFQGSAGSTLSTLWDAVRLRALHTFNEITVHKGELRLERSLNGSMNVADYWDRMDDEKRAELKSGLYHIKAISLDDVKVHYVERVPGRSGAGVIETAEINIHVDGISGAITDIRPVAARDAPADRPLRMPTRVSLAGRSSDGILEVQGAVAFTETDGEPPAPNSTMDPRIRRVSLEAQSPAAGVTNTPLYELHVQLTNIGAAAFTRTVPGLELVATRGVVQGKIIFRDQAPTCESQAAMVDVQFGPNPNVVFVPARYQEIQRQRQNWSYSGEYDPCEGLNPPAEPMPAGGGPTKKAARPGAAAAVVAFSRQATATAPPAIRSAVARDERRVAGEPVTAEAAATETVIGESVGDAAIGDTSSRAAQRLGQAASKLLGPRTGAALQRSVGDAAAPGASNANQPSDNPLAKGAKTVGRGLKKLFGGGQSKEKDKPKP